ncbi:MAG: NRDE family protein [Chitinophagaceae bacterium]
MCTVTFIPSREKIFLTSNRDEKLSRPDAVAPACHRYGETMLLCPADAKSGGTWIALKENGDAAVLLNGAFVKHDMEKPYGRSRGLILLDIFTHQRPAWFYCRFDLAGIEPFTLILFENSCLYELRWDGEKKHMKQLNSGRSYIWSSSTLYNEETARKRENWFAAFLNRHPVPTRQDILRFHTHAGDGEEANALFMRREPDYRTVSTTAILLCEGRGSMLYHDHKQDQVAEKKIELTGIIQAA